MNWNAIGAIGEIVGAIAVISSLLFVGYQLRQGQNIERANGQREMLKQARDWWALTRSDIELNHAVNKLIHNYTDGDSRQQHLFYSWFWDLLLLVEQAFYMHRDGFMNEASFVGFETTAISLIKTPGGDECWKHAREIWGEDARRHILSRIEELGDDVPLFYDLWPHFGTDIQHDV